MDSSSTEPALLCPNCGYDLRAATEDRCSECGLEVDRESLKVSSIPWAHRKEIGRVRAYLCTVRLFAFDAKEVRHEIAKPQDDTDARRFRLITGLLVGLMLCAVFVWAIIETKGVEFLAAPTPADVSNSSRSFRTLNITFETYADFFVPWSAGATIIGLEAAYLILFGLYLAGAHIHVVRLSGQTDEQRRRARAVATYAAAPLVFVWFALIIEIIATLTAPERFKDTSLTYLALKVLAWIVLGMSFVLTIIWTSWWYARASHGGWMSQILAAGEILLRWIVGAVIVLGILPWIVGFLFVVVHSLLR